MSTTPTMRVKLETSLCGHRPDPVDGGQRAAAWHKGDIVDLPVDEARRYIERGYASEHRDDAK